jgi:hypothetical protein
LRACACACVRSRVCEGVVGEVQVRRGTRAHTLKENMQLGVIQAIESPPAARNCPQPPPHPPRAVEEEQPKVEERGAAGPAVHEEVGLVHVPAARPGGGAGVRLFRVCGATVRVRVGARAPPVVRYLVRCWGVTGPGIARASRPRGCARARRAEEEGGRRAVLARQRERRSGWERESWCVCVCVCVCVWCVCV